MQRYDLEAFHRLNIEDVDYRNDGQTFFRVAGETDLTTDTGDNIDSEIDVNIPDDVYGIDTVSTLDSSTSSSSTDEVDPVTGQFFGSSIGTTDIGCSGKCPPSVWQKLLGASQGTGGGIMAGAVAGIGISVVILTGGTAILAGAGAASATTGGAGAALVTATEAAALYACPAGVSATLGGWFGSVVGGVSGGVKGWLTAGTGKNAFHEGFECGGRATAKAAAATSVAVAIVALFTSRKRIEQDSTDGDKAIDVSNTKIAQNKVTDAFPSGVQYGRQHGRQQRREATKGTGTSPNSNILLTAIRTFTNAFSQGGKYGASKASNGDTSAGSSSSSPSSTDHRQHQQVNVVKTRVQCYDGPNSMYRMMFREVMNELLKEFMTSFLASSSPSCNGIE